MAQISDVPDTGAARSHPQFSRNDDGSFAATYRNLRLKSAFQPIFSFAHPQPVGYESLLRAMDSNNAPVSPVQLFYTDPASGTDSQQLERLSQALLLADGLAHRGDPLGGDPAPGRPCGFLLRCRFATVLRRARADLSRRTGARPSPSLTPEPEKPRSARPEPAPIAAEPPLSPPRCFAAPHLI